MVKMDFMMDAIGSSFEESSDSESCEDFSIAEENEESVRLVKAIESKAKDDVTGAKGVQCFDDEAEENEDSIRLLKAVERTAEAVTKTTGEECFVDGNNSVYEFMEDVESVKILKPEVKLKVNPSEKCCDNLCNLKMWPKEVLQRLQTVINKNSKGEIKQNLLDHLHKQSQMGVPTHGFLFGGKYFCRNGFTEVTGVSHYIVREVFKAFLSGQVTFVHGNGVGFRESEATLNFTAWMKTFAHNYGNYAPDEEVIVISSCFTLKDIYYIYRCESPSPYIKKSYFYELFRVKFGPKRLDRTLPRLRISKYSKHSKCDQCLLLDRYQRSCKGETELNFAKSLKQAHRRDFVRARLAIEEHRQSALTDPENSLYLQIDDMDNSKESHKKTNSKSFGRCHNR